MSKSKPFSYGWKNIVKDGTKKLWVGGSGSNAYMIGLCPIEMSLKPYGHILWNDLNIMELNVTQLQQHAFKPCDDSISRRLHLQRGVWYGIYRASLMPVHLNAKLHCTTAIREAKSMRCLVGYKWEATGLIQAGHRRLCLFYCLFWIRSQDNF